jgi:hypothetical protein
MGASRLSTLILATVPIGHVNIDHVNIGHDLPTPANPHFQPSEAPTRSGGEAPAEGGADYFHLVTFRHLWVRV